MLTLGGIVYRFDFEALDELITLKASGGVDSETEVITVSNEEDKVQSTETRDRKVKRADREIDMVRYDTLGLLLQVIMTNEEDMDDALGADRALASMPLNYKIAFNTLLQYGVLKAEE